jgi:hypothetical protein
VKDLRPRLPHGIERHRPKRRLLSRSLPLHYFRRRIEHRAIVAMFVDELPRLLNGDTVFPGEILDLIYLVAGNAISIPRTALRLFVWHSISLRLCRMVKGQARFLVPVLDLNVFRQIGKVNEPTSLFSRLAGSVSFRSFGFSSDCASWPACLSSSSASRCRLRAR